MYEVRVVFACGAVCLLLAGCSSQAARVNPVDVDPSDASSAAIEMYDKDGDGAIAGAELDAVPGIKRYLSLYDRDGDQRVNRDEISNRLQAWADNQLGLMGRTYVIVLDGQPLEGATVTLVPEIYLGANVKPATGETGPTGLVRMSHADEDLPKSANGRPLPGVKGGTFKVQITHPTRKIPEKYNSATELGDEVAYDINTTDAAVTLSLSSK